MLSYLIEVLYRMTISKYCDPYLNKYIYPCFKFFTSKIPTRDQIEDKITELCYYHRKFFMFGFFAFLFIVLLLGTFFAIYGYFTIQEEIATSPDYMQQLYTSNAKTRTRGLFKGKKT